jgi:hypothetical protein
MAVTASDATETMANGAARDARGTHGAAAAILGSTLVAGALDITAAIVQWQFKGVPAIRILQSVAAGVLGRDASKGGAATAALGLLLHFLIMSGIAATFYVASRRMPVLTKHWLAFGLAYGVAVYLVMSFVVVPLSAFPGSVVSSPAGFIQGVLVHMACVGLPIAFITHRLSPAHSQGE